LSCGLEAGDANSAEPRQPFLLESWHPTAFDHVSAQRVLVLLFAPLSCALSCPLLPAYQSQTLGFVSLSVAQADEEV
jgi:hypothetical protein